jgi:Transposase and inactivated derivatives
LGIGKRTGNYKLGNKFLSDCELRKEFTKLRNSKEYVWMKNISNNVTKQAVKDACNTYKRFFQGQCKYLKFKSKKHSPPSFFQDNIKIQFTDTHVKVEGFSMSRKKNKQKLNWIKLCEKGKIPTNCKYMNPRFTYDGLYWYISVGIEIKDNTIPPSNDGIGIDLGIKDLAVCSDKNTYKNINKTSKMKKLEKENVDCNVPYQEDMKRIRKEKVTAKQAIL